MTTIVAATSSSQALAVDITSNAAASRVFTAADILRLKRVTDAEISPDRRWISFVESADDIKTDRLASTLWIVAPAGGAARYLAAGSAHDPHWAPDSDHVAYLADDADGNSQIHVRSIAAGGDAQITHGDLGPGDIAWSPNGRTIAFTAFVAEPAQTLAEPLSPPAGAKWAPPLRFTTARQVVADGSA